MAGTYSFLLLPLIVALIAWGISWAWPDEEARATLADARKRQADHGGDGGFYYSGASGGGDCSGGDGGGSC